VDVKQLVNMNIVAANANGGNGGGNGAGAGAGGGGCGGGEDGVGGNGYEGAADYYDQGLERKKEVHAALKRREAEFKILRGLREDKKGRHSVIVSQSKYIYTCISIVFENKSRGNSRGNVLFANAMLAYAIIKVAIL
jgi:hypothetical protein